MVSNLVDLAQPRRSVSVRGAALLALLAGACAPSAPERPAPRPSSLAHVVDSVTRTPPLDRTHWGVELYDPATRRTLYRLDAEKHFVPASNTKLVVTAVGLGELGADYRYRTDFYATGAPAGSTEAAGLVLVARGDPTLSRRFHPTGPSPLEMLADSVAAAGIRRLSGDLVIDASTFDDQRVNPTWEVDDLPFDYAAPVAAFAIEEGTFRLVVEPGAAPGRGASVTALAPAGAVAVRNQVTTSADGGRRALSVLRPLGSDSVVITGSIPMGAAPDTMLIAVPDPADFAARSLAFALERRGVAIGGRVRVVYDPAEAAALRAGELRPVASWTSAPLAEIVAAILKPSQNWIAEMLLKTLGAERGRRGSWAGGLEVERRYLFDVVAIDSGAVSLRDGSGLSAQNLLTPHAIVSLLDFSRRQPWGATYVQAMAEPGVKGTTLSSRLSGLEGRIYAKTGTIAHVNSLSGYMRAANGEEWIFSILTNASGRPAAEVRRAIDRIAREMAGEGEATGRTP